jgi:hypothetical protein
LFMVAPPPLRAGAFAPLVLDLDLLILLSFRRLRLSPCTVLLTKPGHRFRVGLMPWIRCSHSGYQRTSASAASTSRQRAFKPIAPTSPCDRRECEAPRPHARSIPHRWPAGSQDWPMTCGGPCQPPTRPVLHQRGCGPWLGWWRDRCQTSSGPVRRPG